MLPGVVSAIPQCAESLSFMAAIKQVTAGMLVYIVLGSRLNKFNEAI
jgi:zinc transporter ZupT